MYPSSGNSKPVVRAIEVSRTARKHERRRTVDFTADIVLIVFEEHLRFSRPLARRDG